MGMIKLFAPLFAVTLLASAAGAQPASAPGATTQPAGRGSVKPAPADSEALIEAARRGDENIMRRLTGTPVTLQGRLSRTLRETDDYVDVSVVTGPDFKLAGTRSGFEVVLRIPRTLAPDPMPQIISSSGVLTGFEPPGNPAEPNEIAWTPIITVDFLR
jgi:hypothetical protein